MFFKLSSKNLIALVLLKLLLEIKEQIWIDYLTEQQQAMYEAQMVAQQQQETSVQEEQEEEVNGELD